MHCLALVTLTVRAQVYLHWLASGVSPEDDIHSFISLNLRGKDRTGKSTTREGDHRTEEEWQQKQTRR